MKTWKVIGRVQACNSAVVLKEGGGPLCFLVCDLSSRSLSLKGSAQGTNEPLGRERSNPCCPGNMAVPGFSPLFIESVYLSVYPFISLYISLSIIYLSNHLAVYLSINKLLPVCQSFYPFICLFICLSIYPSNCLSIHHLAPVYLSVYPFIRLYSSLSIYHLRLPVGWL